MGCGSWVGFKVSMVCGVVSVVGINYGGYGLLLVVAGDGYLVVICFVGWDLVGFGLVISVWCYNGGFGGLVCCFNGVLEVVVVVLLLFGWLGVSGWLVWWC